MDQTRTSPSNRRHHAWALLVLGTVAVSLLAVVDFADADALPAPISDYGSYPAALPTGCPNGTAALVGLVFGNDAGDTNSNMRLLSFEPGDTVTMSWTGFDADCLDGSGDPAIAVSLAVYETPDGTFDATVDQTLVDWNVCGLGAPACAQSGGWYSLTIGIPTSDVCAMQVDAVLGLPLEVVGPSGSFYSGATRGHGPNRLLSATNFAVDSCTTTTSTTTTTTTTSTSTSTTTSTTAATSTSTSTSTTAATSTSTSTTAATSTTAVAPPTSSGGGGALPSTVTSAAPSTTAATSTATVTPPSGGASPNTTAASQALGTSLPATGTDTSHQFKVAASLFLIGAVLLLVADRLRRAQPTR